MRLGDHESDCFTNLRFADDAWASFSRYKQELTSRSYFLPHRLRSFNTVITPTPLSYASGTWTLSGDHERMRRSTQRTMLRLIVQTERKYKKRKLNSAGTTKTKKKKKQTTEAPMRKLQREAVLTPN